MMRTYTAVQVIENRYFIHILKIRQWSLLGKKKGRKKERQGRSGDGQQIGKIEVIVERTYVTRKETDFKDHTGKGDASRADAQTIIRVKRKFWREV